MPEREVTQGMVTYTAEGGTVMFCGRRVALGRAVESGIRAAGGEATYRRADVRVSLKAGGRVECAHKTMITCELERLQFASQGHSVQVGVERREVGTATACFVPVGGEAPKVGGKGGAVQDQGLRSCGPCGGGAGKIEDPVGQDAAPECVEQALVAHCDSSQGGQVGAGGLAREEE